MIRQKDSMLCGASCLAMICNYYGKQIKEEAINKMCPPSKAGVSILSLDKTASLLGFDTACVRTDISNLSSNSCPILLHWNNSHFVVLYKVSPSKKTFYIADPAQGKIKCSVEEFIKRWTNTEDLNQKGIALFLEPNSRFIKDSNGKENHLTFRFLFKYLKIYRSYVINIILGLLLGCILQLIMPFLTQSIIDLGVRHEDVKLIWLILLGELMIVFGRTVTDFIRHWLLLHISMKVNISLISDFLIKLLELPMAFFESKFTGDLIQRIADHSRVQSFLTEQLLGIVFTCLSFIVFGVVLLIYNYEIFLIFLIGSILYVFWICLFLNRRKKIDYELFEIKSINNNRTYQFLNTIQETKLQNCEQKRRWEWEDAQAELFEIQSKSLKLQQTQETGALFINELKNILITVFAASAVINGQMTLGAMLAIQYIIGQLNSPISQFINFIYTLQDVKISLERINEIHGSQGESDFHGSLQNFNNKKAITVSNLFFKYDIHSPEYILKNINFDIPAGKITAIVGSSGSGKSTLIKLLLGYYSLQNGDIKISENPISDFDIRWWRNNCGVVMQESVIFSDTIAGNIAMGDNDIDYDRLKKSADLAVISDFIETLPLKYETKIGPDGMNLSKGQMQRILIARIIYKNPDFIFLDEATNSLDATNEKRIVSNLEEFFKGKTVVIVAHRLSTVKNADHIVVMDKGEIIEKGNHGSLLEKKGQYYNLIKDQLEIGE